MTSIYDIYFLFSTIAFVEETIPIYLLFFKFNSISTIILSIQQKKLLFFE